MSKDKKNEALAVPMAPLEIRLTDNAAQPSSSSGVKKAVEKAASFNDRHPGLPYAIASAILGPVALVAIIILGFFSIVGPLALLPYGIGIVAGVVGLVCASIAKKKGDTSGLATTGMVTNIIALAAAPFVILLFVGTLAACVSCFSAMLG